MPTPLRIYHLDLKVAMFQVSWLKRWFARLRDAGYGGVCIEIDNKLVFPSHPGFAAPDALSADQWRELVRHGRSLGLLVYPLIQTLGHMEHVLAPDTPLRRLAESPGNAYMLCPTKPAARAFIADLVRDAYEVFDHPPRIHLGGDECPHVGICPHCHGRPLTGLLTDFMLHLHETASRLGMRTEFWADMVLAHPATLDALPKEIHFVDWLYSRTAVRGPRLAHCWGFRGTAAELTPQQLLAALPAELDPVRPFLVDTEGHANAFYGAHFLKARGYTVTVASGVRSGGDSYCLPRTRQSVLNVGATEAAAGELEADHMVTSWAVRLSHPETTWPALRSRRPDTRPVALAELGASLGGLDPAMLDDLDLIQRAISGIDVVSEQQMRFQRPCYGNWLGHLNDLFTAPDAAERLEAIGRRAAAAERLAAVFEARLARGEGVRDELRHWICGLQLARLRARQCLALHGSGACHALAPLIEENRSQMAAFAELWGESLTPYSLINELEVKFQRDIRVLGELSGASLPPM